MRARSDGAHPRERGAGATAVAFVMGASVLAACSDGADMTRIETPDVADAAGGSTLYLSFPSSAAAWRDSPARLSETGAFRDLAALVTAPGLMPYEVRAPLWSDGAHKLRWVALPPAARVTYAEDGAWQFPAGTVFIKHFELALDEREPERRQRLETRFLIAADDGGYYGVGYRWNAEQTDGALIEQGADEQLSIVQSDGSTRGQTYTFPSSASCPSCHNAAAGPVLGVHTAQLNGERAYDASDGARVRRNQLATWLQLGLIEGMDLERPISDYPRFASLTDESRPAIDRLRAYWHSNCSACHNASSGLPSWDARYTTPLEDQGLIWAEPLTGPAEDGAHLIVPGEPDRSLLYRRVASAEPGVRMPPVLRNRVDDVYVELLAEWIRDLDPR